MTCRLFLGCTVDGTAASGVLSRQDRHGAPGPLLRAACEGVGTVPHPHRPVSPPLRAFNSTHPSPGHLLLPAVHVPRQKCYPKEPTVQRVTITELRGSGFWQPQEGCPEPEWKESGRASSWSGALGIWEHKLYWPESAVFSPCNGSLWAQLHGAARRCRLLVGASGTAQSRDPVLFRQKIFSLRT